MNYDNKIYICLLKSYITHTHTHKLKHIHTTYTHIHTHTHKVSPSKVNTRRLSDNHFFALV